MNDKAGGQAADALMGIFGFKRVEEKAMDKVSEARRALFEAWAASNLPTSLSMRGPSYASLTTHKSWQAFNAALDAVEIELPDRDPKGSGSPDSEMGASLEQYEGAAYNFGLDDCRSAIESTNLGLRIK